jgi:hypothetical protein
MHTHRRVHVGHERFGRVERATNQQKRDQLSFQQFRKGALGNLTLRTILRPVQSNATHSAASLASATEEAATESMREICAHRLRSLYTLLFHTCGCSHRAAQRALGRDVRGILGARDFPSLDCVIELSRALGLSPSVVVDLLASSEDDAAREARREHTGPTPSSIDVGAHNASFEALVLRADLDENAHALASLLEVVPPDRSNVRTALVARLSTIRGAWCDRSRDLHHEHNAPSCALSAVLDLTRYAESELAKTWCLRDHVSCACDEGCHDASHLESRHALSALVCDSVDVHALTVRADFHLKSLDIIEHARQSKAGLIDATSRLEMLARHREALMLQGDSIAHVWTISIVGLTALRVLRIAHAHSDSGNTRIPYRDACVRRIAIETGFMLDDATRCGNPRAERLACARRARCILAEQAVRSADGEIVLERADEHDLLELRAAALRFPDAGGFIQRFRNQTTFSQLAHFTIDASSAHRRMRALVPVHAFRVANARDRSESRC